jgi:hypothetical protein
VKRTFDRACLADVRADHPGEVVFELQTGADARLVTMPSSDRQIEVIPGVMFPVDMLDGACIAIHRTVPTT